MKRIITILLTVAIGILLTGCAEEADDDKVSVKAGKYSATEQGYGGPVTVEVTVDEAGKITEVSYDAKDETAEIGIVAAENMAEEMEELNTPNVDSIAGATITSKAFIKAARTAVSEAGISVD